MIEQLKTIQTGLAIAIAIDAEGFVDKPVRRALLDAVKAAAQLETIVGTQGPVALSRDEQRLRLWQAIQGAAKAGVAHDDKLIVEELRQAGYCIAAAPVAQQPQVMVDMVPPATARDRWMYEQGRLAERDPRTHTAQQPQARPDFTDEWAGYLKDGETPFERFLRERKDLQSVLKLYQRVLEENERLKAQQPQADTCQMCGDKPHPGCNSEFQGDKACRFWPAPDSSYRDDNYWRGWNAAIRSQQPQAETDNHEARGQIEFLDKKNNALLAAIRKVMARLADLLDEDQFKEIEEIVSFAGVQPQAEAVPVVDRVYEAAKRLVDHADFQLGGVLSAKSKARDIPSNAASKVKARHLASLRDALAKTPQQAEAVPSIEQERKEAEQQYSITAFNYPEAPIGSRDWVLYWAGWLARSTAFKVPQQAAAIAQQKGQP